MGLFLGVPLPDFCALQRVFVFDTAVADDFSLDAFFAVAVVFLAFMSRTDYFADFFLTLAIDDIFAILGLSPETARFTIDFSDLPVALPFFWSPSTYLIIDSLDDVDAANLKNRKLP